LQSNLFYISPQPHIQKHYDYIIAGAGCAGLSLLVRMIASGKFADKRILLVDKESKTTNDRTWCFWEEGKGYFEDIVYKRWNRLWFHADGFSRLYDINPYQYKMICGIDFYEHCFRIIASEKNIDIQYGEIIDINSDVEQPYIRFANQKIKAAYIFNSIAPPKPVLKSNEHFLLQHFKGWTIETTDAKFLPGEATLMDFRVSQENGTSFIYIMPFSSTTALVEYTLFTPKLLSPGAYDSALYRYIKETLGCNNFKINGEEFGVIPMTNHRWPSRKGNVINIGTAGGQTKPSTGYTFQFIQQHSQNILDALASGEKNLNLSSPSRKFRFYDAVLLNVLATKKMQGARLFATLFKENDPRQLFKFLDNESSYLHDLKIIGSLPTFPFLKAALDQVF
jgi:lycopene beta-cyclase